MSMTATADVNEIGDETSIHDANREERGNVIERLICILLELEHVPDDDVELYDARFNRPGHVLDGRPGEIKSCLPWIDGDSRRGRFWINRDAHDELVERDGVYIFVVVDPETTVESPGVLAYATIPANEHLTEWLTWSPTGQNHRVDRAAQFPFSKLFPNLETNHD